MNTGLAILIVFVGVVLYLSGLIFSLAFLFRLLANITGKSWQGVIARAFVSPINLVLALTWPASAPVVAIVAAIIFAGNVILDTIFDHFFYWGIALANHITGD